MASSFVLKRFVSSTLLPRSFSRTTIVPTASSASRFFNTNAVRHRDDESDARDLDVDRRSVPHRRDFFSDVFDPFSPTRSLSQVLNLMDQMTENPFFAGTRGGLRRGWDAIEDENALKLRIDMPGLGKEDVNVSVEQSTLVIKGEGAKEADDEESIRRYTSRIDLPEKMYKTDEIKAEMKNGVLKVVVPKVKEEERSDVFQVTVE
ncbi:heat shock 22 kDa protein, mitochondrial-like [Mangifera indica]|uniref:heat shock 22 kDa protein, mitochondrial-like n=1 Tax=Mangifera indica TaxID=29780 RepID=UPI001CFA1122|nr:heat shock 22 kDa protein, mitochondrial-like [Mangifera indica]